MEKVYYVIENGDKLLKELYTDWNKIKKERFINDGFGDNEIYEIPLEFNGKILNSNILEEEEEEKDLITKQSKIIWGYIKYINSSDFEETEGQSLNIYLFFFRCFIGIIDELIDMYDLGVDEIEINGITQYRYYGHDKDVENFLKDLQEKIEKSNIYRKLCKILS